MIYLDNAATTEMIPEVVEEMKKYMEPGKNFGNPNSIYKIGLDARDAIEKARERVADLVCCDPDHIVFTSGGSEANSLVFHGVAPYLKEIGKKTILVSSLEHDSVINSAESVCKEYGFDLIYIPVDSDGTVSYRFIDSFLRLCDNVGLVSVMYESNMTGTVNDVCAISELCRKYGVLFHTDCVQALYNNEINVTEIGCDFATFSAHKIHGPKGTGALYTFEKDMLKPIINGGSSQEYGLRGGTENVAGIVGFGSACRELSKIPIELRKTFLNKLSETFVSRLKTRLEIAGNGKSGIKVNSNDNVSEKTVSITIDGVDAETLVLVLSSKDIYISAGSACRSHESEPDPTLLALGLSKDDARNTIRVSFSMLNTMSDVEQAAEQTARYVTQLREIRKNYNSVI